ncbi:manganese-binding transcriptional regulator MntR [Sphingomonas sp.]|jgi:DtxR family manganese transport transcriptional regulator|uniref:manganese-binding transcriptional regulator MntR n=1 Tax=Sphingomonas sp. TaxID=28214 RepID=UPI002625065B|nr:manganese-binding transcriptional regulator MntR [Sphingomonas sp.]MDF2494921.1 iron (metal) dependent repressor, DtxR family [Sphingomonas sp.]
MSLSAADRAAAFRKTREANLTEVSEDYVELIGDLIATEGEARLTDIAERLGVAQATASKVITRLRRDGLVENKRYRSIFLTERGREIADASRERHRVVLDFLLALGLDPAVARADSEGIEHHVSAETLAKLEALTARLTSEGN